MIFNREEQQKRIGDLELSDSLEPLREVEEYFKTLMKEYPTEYCHDVTALENPFFKTIGYTTYANCMIMYPLQFELSFRQVMKATGVGVERDFAGFFESKILTGQANKYRDRQKALEPVDTLVVLPGGNKIVEHLSLSKLVWVLDSFPNVGIKPHPLTEDKLLKELQGKIGTSANILPKDSDLYGYMVNCRSVFTTHMSESAAYGASLGKNIYPIDKYELRLQESFSHLNAPMFIEHNPRGWINKTFSDYRSGVVNPVIEPNWKEKMKAYLDFIHDERELFLNAYID